MLSKLTLGTFLFLCIIYLSIIISQNGEVQGASMALEPANAQKLALAANAPKASGWEIWFWDPWGNWVWYEFTLVFASRGQAFKAKEAEAKRELSIKSKQSCRGQVKSSRRGC